MAQTTKSFPGEASFQTYEDVFSELRTRALEAIARNEHVTKEGQHVRVRIRDERGLVLFEGTMKEAASAYPALNAKGDLISVCGLQ